MNSNISTQRRIRRTHAKFVAISAAAAAANNVGGEDGEGGDGPTVGPTVGLAGDVDADDAEVDAVDERPWPVPRPSQKLVSKGPLDVAPDIGEMAAEKCIQWVNRKILEHVGFSRYVQSPESPESHNHREYAGSSQLALDVFSGITLEYLSNVGRTFRFYLDKCSNIMTCEARRLIHATQRAYLHLP